MTRTRATALAVVVAAALAGTGTPASAAGPFDEVVAEYQKTQRVDACNYTDKQLRSVQRDLGSDVEQYLPGLEEAIADALASRETCPDPGNGEPAQRKADPAPLPPRQAPSPPPASGSPAPTTTATAAPAPPASPTPAPVPAVPSATPGDRSVITAAVAASDPQADGLRVPIIILLVVGLQAVILAGAVTIAARLGMLKSLDHALGEAAWRTSLRWAEFRDWIRFGSGR